ncbi:hypothetical protein MPTK2_4g19830 [Marchantia polymorpha subsp. ruderalis]
MVVRGDYRMRWVFLKTVIWFALGLEEANEIQECHNRESWLHELVVFVLGKESSEKISSSKVKNQI